MNPNADLDDLIREPREALDVEVKEWLDLSDHDHRAVVAKEIIALANHGGGKIVVGYEELPDGTFRPAEPRPENLHPWSQDNIQAIVAKYVDPSIQCRVLHRASPSTGEKHPVIVVPGGHRVPVRAKAGSPDQKRLVANRVYIRRSGPNSEEPRTTEEWDRLFERCLQNRKTELLEAMRSIMEGEIPAAVPKTPTRLDQLITFERQAISRWEERVASIPQTAPARFAHGYYEFALAIDGYFERKSLVALRDIIKSAVRNHSGWPPFLTIHRAPFTPTPVDGAIETWIGPDRDGSFETSDRSDFWRISPEGLLFTRRGYSEDGRFLSEGYKDLKPGTFVNLTTPIWRVGEIVMEASYIAQALKATDANLICRCRWTGLAGRNLVSLGDPRRIVAGNYSCTQDTYEASETISISALPGALPELVFAILSPLYNLFDFFELPKRLVQEELATLLS